MLTRRHALLLLSTAPLAACETLDPAILDGLGGLGGGTAGLSAGEVALGLKAALDNGVGNALLNLGTRDGFLGDPQVRIPLPGVLADLQGVLGAVGADGLLVELQQQLNRGAEAAVPVARDIFVDAVRGLTIQDAFAILRGPDTAATDYLRGATTARLTSLFSPIMENALADTGALRLVDDVQRQVPLSGFAGGLAGGGDLKGALVDHGVEFGLNGVFHYIGQEEAAIRANPAKRTSEILRRVFG